MARTDRWTYILFLRDPRTHLRIYSYQEKTPFHQAVVPYPAYMNRGNGRGAPGRGRQRVDVNRMRTLLTQRVPVKDIASEMGVSRLCVYYWLVYFSFLFDYSHPLLTNRQKENIEMR